MDTYKTNANQNGSAKTGRIAKYKADMVDAFDIGYASGWDTSYDVPNCLFGKLAATYGFKKGLRDRRRADTYIKRYKKKGKNYK